MKKICISICAFSIVFLTSFSGVVQAKEPHVTDCLEGNADCSEEDEGNTNAAETDQEETISEVTNTGPLIFDLVKMVFALFLVLGLIYLLLKFLSKRNKLFHQVKALENLGGISVGQNKSIQIVRIGPKVFLIGVGENVEMLHEVTDEEIKKDLLHKDESNDFQATTWLTSFLQPKSKGKAETSKDQSQKAFKKLYSNELAKLKQTREQMINEQVEKEDKHE